MSIVFISIIRMILLFSICFFSRPPPAPIDLELPVCNNYYLPPVVSDVPSEPPVKRFKEKTIETLDPEVSSNTSTSFKKRKFAAKGNARKRLEDD